MGAAVSIFHRHHWSSVAVRQMETQLYYRSGPRVGEEFGPPEPTTEVLQRCKCDRLRTITLSGHWPLDEVAHA